MSKDNNQESINTTQTSDKNEEKDLTTDSSVTNAPKPSSIFNRTIKIGKKEIKALYIAIAAFVLIVAVTLTMVFTLTSGSQASPERVWSVYVNAYNSQDFEKLAGAIYPEDSQEYNDFINDNSGYFDTERLGSETIDTEDFSIVFNNDRFAYATVTIITEDSQSGYDIYFKKIDGKWYLYSDIDFSSKSTDFVTIG